MLHLKFNHITKLECTKTDKNLIHMTWHYSNKNIQYTTINNKDIGYLIHDTNHIIVGLNTSFVGELITTCFTFLSEGVTATKYMSLNNGSFNTKIDNQIENIYASTGFLLEYIYKRDESFSLSKSILLSHKLIKLTKDFWIHKPLEIEKNINHLNESANDLYKWGTNKFSNNTKIYLKKEKTMMEQLENHEFSENLHDIIKEFDPALKKDLYAN